MKNNYFWARDHSESTEAQWVRTSDCEGREFPRKLVLVNGTFDLLHAGHIRLLMAARAKAKTMIIALDSDRLVTEKKGPGRPVLSWIERATALGYLGADFLVEIDKDHELVELIQVIKPDLRVKGSDQIGKPTRFPDTQIMFVQARGVHTSGIVQRIKVGK